MSGLQLRVAGAADAPALMDLYDEYDRPAAARPSQAQIEAILARLGEQGQIVLAEKAGQLLGTCSIYICPSLNHGGVSFAVIEHVIVTRAARRQGIGRALLAYASQYAQQVGCYKIMLATGNGRPHVHQFYQACGFKGDKIGFQQRFPLPEQAV